MKFEFTLDDLMSSGDARRLLLQLATMFMEPQDVEKEEVFHEAEVLPEVQPEAEKPKRGRKPKEKPPQEMTAAELHEALKASETPVVSVEEPPPEMVEPLPSLNHDELVGQVRDLMFVRAHVWMRNVLEQNKKVAKTMAEFPDTLLAEILANPDKYED